MLAGAAPASADADAPAGVQFRVRGDGAVLTTASGMTLYTFARDQTPGKSACNGGCAKTWPPLTAAPDAKPSGAWSVIARDDGSSQWAFRGQPLYTYSRDAAAGESYGDDVGGQWHVAFRPIFTPPEVGLAKTLRGTVLATASGLTLYTSDRDTAKESRCDAACSRTWHALAAPWAARAVGDWTIVPRGDGLRQWAFKGKPLYAYAGDSHTGALLGDGVDKSWHAAVLEPPPPVPAWVRVHQSDAGEVLTDARGRTLYQRAARPRGPALELGDMGSDDAPPAFHPVTVAETEDAQPVGNWSIIGQNGTKQWAYKGLPLYTNENDVQPGDLKGVRGSDRSFHTIMRSGEPMQGTGQ